MVGNGCYKVKMSKIRVSVDSKKQLTIHTATGKVTRDEIVEVQEKYYTNDPTTYLLWDLRAANISALSSDDLKEIVFIGKKYAQKRRNGKTAIVVSSDLSFGLSRMYESYSEMFEHPGDHWVTKEYDEAMKWLLA